VGGPDQPVYLNGVVLARTRLAPFTLLAALHAIEADHGRVRETRWGARSLDLDLIQYGDPDVGCDLVSHDPELILPHPRAHERAFVLAPWSALDAEAQLRVGEELVPVSELLERVEQDGIRPGPQWSPSW
jgi:dihydroneopterin aldolase/2-amino-4-hydroxy-6-hydroxymethyldihydropteridine diphosphokinase